MVTIDLSTLSVREGNMRLRAAAAHGEDIEILNPDARHQIGVGLTRPVTVRVRGSAGYFCAGLSHGARFEVESNVGWGVGDAMEAGSVVVGGNAGAVAAVALRGGEVVVKGNVGGRAGQVMTAGTLLACGNASFLAGYMMSGGRIIILGESGERVGEHMAGGAIYVGGRVQSLGAGAQVAEMTAEEDADIRVFLAGYGIPFAGSFTKIVHVGTTLCDDAVGPRIHGAARPVPDFSDIAIKLAPSRIGVSGDPIKAVKLAMTLGERHGATPLRLSMPVLIAPTHLGAVSQSTKIALARASRLSGVAENTGEGGMLPEQRDEAAQLIYQCRPGRLGWNIHDMQKADALEIHISQCATPGLRAPSRHPDIMGADDLVIKVEEFREATGYTKPISVTMAAGRVRDDVKIAYKDGFDFVQLDGLHGATDLGIPTLAALQEALDGLNEIGHDGSMPVVMMGGIMDGVDAVKALALGAGAVAMHPPEPEARDQTEAQVQAIHRFLESVRWQIAAITQALGYDDFRQLSRKDLVALTPEAAAITGLPYEPDYRAEADALAARVAQRRAFLPLPQAGQGRPTFDELVFLPANLTRLVIEPDREACQTRTELGGGLVLRHPLLVGGLDAAPAGIKAAAAATLRDSGSAYVGREGLAENVPWLQVLAGEAKADAAAVVVLAVAAPHAMPTKPELARADQKWGVVATAANLDAAITLAVRERADLLVLDGSGDLSVLPAAVAKLRALRAEEVMPVLWFGGLRSGGDLAKALALGCTGGIACASAASDDPAGALGRFLQAAVAECALMARRTGKTNVHNLEPEDLRTTSLAAQTATGIAMVGMRKAGLSSGIRRC